MHSTIDPKIISRGGGGGSHSGPKSNARNIPAQVQANRTGPEDHQPGAPGKGAERRQVWTYREGTLWIGANIDSKILLYPRYGEGTLDCKL